MLHNWNAVIDFRHAQVQLNINNNCITVLFINTYRHIVATVHPKLNNKLHVSKITSVMREEGEPEIKIGTGLNECLQKQLK